MIQAPLSFSRKKTKFQSLIKDHSTQEPGSQRDSATKPDQVTQELLS